MEFAFLVAGWARAGYSLEIPQVVLRGSVVRADRHGIRHDYDPFLRRHLFSTFHMTDETMRQYLDRIHRIGPCFVLAYPSSMAMLARYIVRSGATPPPKILGILLGSEMVYPQDRELIARVFGLRAFSWYGLSEKVALAAECEHSTDYHVWPGYGYVELLDSHDRPITTPGMVGEIVGTSFMNTAMPLIRYRTGDIAEYVADRCGECGRKHMLLRDVRGHRTQEMLVAADESLIPWTALNMHDDTFLRVRQFQFVQEKPGAAILRLVPGDGFGEPDSVRIEKRLQEKLDGRLTFLIQLSEHIEQTRVGKSVYVRHESEATRRLAAGVVGT
jgi:phenylacetate-CoA ligase